VATAGNAGGFEVYACGYSRDTTRDKYNKGERKSISPLAERLRAGGLAPHATLALLVSRPCLALVRER